MTSKPALAVVLDTNTVLDWLVFRDACATPIAAAVEAGVVRWLACVRMRDELQRTLGYASLAKWNPDCQRTLASFDRLAQVDVTPPPAPLHLRCSDPDDQVFVDLALAGGARWLLTHDRALLRLARRARPLGLLIMQPGHWLPA
jgi:uncharacterized protein